MVTPDVKSEVRVDNGSSEQSLRDALASGGGADEKAGTADDRADMFRMGKTQELRVSQHFISSIPLMSLATITGAILQLLVWGWVGGIIFHANALT